MSTNIDSGQRPDLTPLSAKGMETLILRHLREVPGCDGVTSVVVYRLADGVEQDGLDWKIKSYNPGSAPATLGEIDTALAAIRISLGATYTIEAE